MTSAGEPVQPAAAAARVFAFEVGGRLYGARPETVAAVELRPPPPTLIPGAEPHVLGVVNERGSALAIFDLALFLGHQPTPASRLVVLRGGGCRAGVPAQRVLGLIDCPPLSPPDEDQAFALGVGLHGPQRDRTLVLLDIPALLGAAACRA